MDNSKKSLNLDNTDEIVKPSDLRRKIIGIAKKLFLNPTDGIKPKEKAPSKKAISSHLTLSEIKYLNENEDKVFPHDIPERVFWDVYSGKNMERRREVLLRITAEDDAIKVEKSIIKEQPPKKEVLPGREQILSKLPEDERSVLLKYNEPILSATYALRLLQPGDRLHYMIKMSKYEDDEEKHKLPTVKINDSQMKVYYNSFINMQKPLYIVYMNLINDLLYELKKYRRVRDRSTYTARVKSFNSAIVNDSKDGKALDDIFGMEIDFSTEDEKSEIMQVVSATLNLKSKKHPCKSNGYEAHHYSGIPKDIGISFEESELYSILEELYGEKIFFNSITYNVKMIWENYQNKLVEEINKIVMEDLQCKFNSPKEKIESIMPLIEFQFKTIDKAIHSSYGEAAHYKYKKNNTQKKVESEEEFEERIQNHYTQIIEMFGYVPTAPEMWYSNIDGSDMRDLSSIETVKHDYPFFIDPSDLIDLSQEQNDWDQR